MGYNEVILADAPVVYWKLTEAAGSSVMVDASGNGRDGGYSGSPTFGTTGLIADDTTTLETSTTFAGSALGLYGMTSGTAPLAYWKLTEASGTVMIDSSGHSRNGAYVNSMTLNQPGLLATDAAAGEKSILFGNGSYGAGTSTVPATAQVTVEAICHPDSVPAGGGTVVDRWLNIPVDANHYWTLGYGTFGFQWGVRRLTDNVTIYAFAAAAAGSTYRVTATSGDGQSRIYINGKLASTTSAASGPVATTGNSQLIYIGANEYILNTTPFAGRIEKVAVFDRVLSASEIAARSWVTDVSQNVFNAWLNMPTISVEAIVQPTTVGSGYQIIVERDNNNDQGAPGRIWNMIMSNGHPSWTIYTAQTKFVNVSADTITMVPGTTYHLVGTYDGTTATLYVNGTAVAAKTIAGPLFQPSIQGVSVGNRDILGNVFNGKIEKVSIYNKALTPAQVSTHYQAGFSGTTVPVLDTPGLSGDGTGAGLGTGNAATFFIGTSPR